MVAVHTPSLRNRAEILRQLRECRTFAFGDVMDAAADEMEAMQREIDQLRARLPDTSHKGVAR